MTNMRLSESLLPGCENSKPQLREIFGRKKLYGAHQLLQVFKEEMANLYEKNTYLYVFNNKIVVKAVSKL